MKRFNLCLVVVLSLLWSGSPTMACLTSSSGSQGYVYWGSAAWNVLAKATPDECYYGVGDTSNQYPMTSACDGTFKRNDGYIWGMTKFQDKIFLGTGANVACLVAENYLLVDEAIQDPDYICEVNKAAFPREDFRTPNLYMYTKTGGLKALVIPAAAEPLRQGTVGIRAAGVHSSGIVLMAGPMVQAYGAGINFFAFAGQNGAFMGAANLGIGENIRNIYTTAAGEIYVGVGGMEAGQGTGSVYKWKGNPAAIFAGDRSTLFDFEKVGAGLDGEAAQLMEHDGRLFITTWPNSKDPNNYAGLWMSPPLPLTSANTTGWTKLWSANKYDPFPLAAKLYGGGALQSFGGYLYWGTMHVPGMTYYYMTQQMGGEPSSDYERAILADEVNRSFSLFRGKNFGTNSQSVELLYGGYSGGYFRNLNTSTKKFYDKKNLMGLTPKYGQGGIENKYNNYCWTMNLFKNHLYVGTMDYSPLTQYFLHQSPPNSTFGGDLFRFDSTTTSAKKISDNGLGNENQYGIRTMISDSDSLYLGTAGNSNIQPGGGWELIGLKESAWANDFIYNGPYRSEAEKMRSSGDFRVDDDTTASEDQIMSGDCGYGSSLTDTFSGNSGSYNVAIRYYDTGRKTTANYMKLYVNEKQCGATKTLTYKSGWYFWHLDGVKINKGETVKVYAKMGSHYYNNKFKIDFIDYVPGVVLPPPPVPVSKVTFYQDTNYGGSAITLAAGSYPSVTAAGIPNDWASSVNIPPGYTVEVYSDYNFSGTKWTFTSSSTNFVAVGCNDVMSSVKVISGGVVPPSGTTYGGNGNALNLSLLQPGDFIMLSGVISNAAIPGGMWTHTGIYVGNGQMVEAWDPVSRQVPVSIILTASTAAIYRVNTSATVKQAAVSFALAQLGKPYDWSWTSIPPSGGKDVNSSEWYCSELVWAAYKSQGVELDSNSLPGNHVVPIELTQTSNVTKVDTVNVVTNNTVSTGDPSGYTKCANENGTYTFNTKVDVAYGANGKFNYKYGVTGSITFNNDTFGDPIPGIVKAGYYKDAGSQGTGTIRRQVWTGISGTTIAALTDHANYPNNPSSTNELTSFEAPTNWADNYGTRIVGYVHAPVSGTYTFWIAADDNAELWLSTNDSAGNKKKIAYVPGWSNSREWTKFTQQKSVGITLMAGQRYYIEALQKEGGGGDNLAVAWQRPGGVQEVIPGNCLSLP